MFLSSRGKIQDTQGKKQKYQINFPLMLLSSGLFFFNDTVCERGTMRRLNATTRGQSVDLTAFPHKDQLNILQVDFHTVLKGMNTNPEYRCLQGKKICIQKP